MGHGASVLPIRVFSLAIFLVAAFLAAFPALAPAQNIQWLRQFGTDRDEQANAVATTFGSVYVAGETVGAFAGQTNAGNKDVFVTRYDNLGNQIWVRQFGTAAEEVGTGVAADASGVYVAGWTAGTLPQQTSSGGWDAFVRKYDPNGTELWTRQFGTTATDQAFAIAVDSTGVYVVGFVDCCGAALPGFPTTGGADAFIRKYDANGNEIWTRQFGTIEIERAHGVAIFGSGIYVAGITAGELGTGGVGGRDGFLRRYDVNGNVVWTRQFGSRLSDITNVTDDAFAVAAGSSGIYVSGGVAQGAFTGQTFSGGLWDAYVIKFNPDGVQQWVPNSEPMATITPTELPRATASPMSSERTVASPSRAQPARAEETMACFASTTPMGT